MLHYYESRTQLANRYSVSLSTVDNRQRRIKQLVGKRYPKNSFVDSDGIHRIRSDVFDDLMLNGNKIAAGVAPEFRGGR